MEKEYILINSCNIIVDKTNHLQTVEKSVYLKNGDVNNITQFATTVIEENTIIEKHKHATMKEIFYVEYGDVDFIVNNKVMRLSKGDLIVIKQNTFHSLRPRSKTKLVYLGVLE